MRVHSVCQPASQPAAAVQTADCYYAKSYARVSFGVCVLLLSENISLCVIFPLREGDARARVCVTVKR